MSINRLLLIGVAAAAVGISLALFIFLTATDNTGISASRPHTPVNQTDDVRIEDLGPAVNVTRRNGTD